MSGPTHEKLRELVAHGRWDHAVAGLTRLDPADAAGFLSGLRFEDQQVLFRALPVDAAAAILGEFPYYHAYVLVHSRPIAEVRAIIDRMDPGARLQLFDELPEEAWRHLMDEVSGAPAAASAQGETAPAAVIAEAVPAAPIRVAAVERLEPIVEAWQVEKRYEQPDGRTIQV
ncbi:MAG TPA: hypothetical protein VKU44_07945, partial [Terriglobia bacterium]|nr:hypothetical protein [Terriglobia bacterium]